MTDKPTTKTPYLTRDALAVFLQEKGFPIAKGTLDQRASKGTGPTPEKYWGNRPLYTRKGGLAWAKSRLRDVRP
jgi:hypothetical protein